ncbi:PhrB Deoxyribodipyrimidine photolyase [Pyrenophora tritici-repentis]|nr:PhrB Deoxyribodipyrimidine photolyase [Pyrenophora tritici-repentis]KAI0591340.1 PhrB Deoxyribodipyrimidine photolyase [Pyrenophora tritici-repentis]
MSSKVPRILLYVLRRDVRLSDNPIFHTAALQTARQTSWRNSANSDRRHRDDSLTSEHGGASFTHLLPVYVWSANQIEVSGFLPASTPSPYPEARSAVAKVWRTGPHRVQFIADGVWDLKNKLADLDCGSGLEQRVGKITEVVSDILDCRDLPYDNIADLPNVYTTFRKVFEPLRDRPRETLPTPSLLPPLPPSIPPQKEPFSIPSSLADLKKALLSPLEKDPAYTLKMPPKWPTDAQSAHPFSGGESAGLQRIAHLVASGAMSSYKQTRNGMLGLDFSTKLSAYLAQGHITARQVHWAMLDFEEGRGPGEKKHAYGQGENEGTAAVRFELLWRDYMRLCMRKFGHKMFGLYGIQDRGAKGSQHKKWKKLYKGEDGEDPQKTMEVFERFRSGRTGVGLIDASNRELFVTGYTSNRARQNVASFLSSHLNIDWRVGAEWYECFLVDYDAASNWGNWQYVAGVGNDPRQGRVFNPVKQALDYDKRGEYIKAWVPELRDIKLTRTVGPGREEVDQQRLMGLYQAWKLSDWEKSNLGLKGLDWVEEPLTRIQFQEEVVVVIKDPTGIKGGKAKKRNGQRGSLVMAPRL